MKQIKVYITAEQWAEKRLQLYCAKNYNSNVKTLDDVIKMFGFELIEEETKPDFKRCGEGDNLCKCKSEKECGYSPDTKPNGCADGYVRLAKGSYKSKDGTIKKGVKLSSSGQGDYYAPCDDLFKQPQPSEIPTDKDEALRYYLNELPEGYRERALIQVKNVTALVDSIIDAIREFRDWTETKEGRQFWSQVYRHYLNPNKFPTLPPLPND